ncbi:single-stranded DNA-binding protein [Candidatus Solincola tengchongensis]|uniref:single-stranded DNA-binding protein n=1 Tax=Candidatus Solincola tengchongensis TaxID=2900693 RepID=UPI00257FCD9C|nr:single-stranded DNA-binding protein [Candidatus Solincola tengchongensis]
MAGLNSVVLIGNLTRDPELRYTPSGVPVCTLRLAVSRNFPNQQGEVEADYFNVIVWRNQAEKCAEYLTKGRQVAVTGRLQSRSWEGADGQKRSTIEIVADRVVFLGRRDRADDMVADLTEVSLSEDSDLDADLEPRVEDEVVF